MSKNTLRIFKNGKYALQRSRDFLAQLSDDDGTLYAASCSHFYAAHKPPSSREQLFLSSIIDKLTEYISTRSIEKRTMEQDETEGKTNLDCHNKINAAFAFSEFLDSGGYYKEVLVEKLNRKNGWKSLADGRLAKIVCCYLSKESTCKGCDFNTPLGRSMAVNKWKLSLLGRIERSKAEFEERIKAFPERWTDFNTLKYLKANPNCTTLIIPDRFEEVDTRSFYSCMAGIKKIMIDSPMESISGYDFLQCPDLQSVVINGRVAHLSDLNSFCVLEGLLSIRIKQSLKRIMKNSIANSDSFEHLYIEGGVDLIDKAALAKLKKCHVIHLGTIKGMMPTKCLSITIPRVGEVGECAFLGSSGVRAIVLGAGVGTIKPLAFSKCVNLSFVMIHNQIKSFDCSAFFGCENLRCVIASDLLIKAIRDFYTMEFGYEKTEAIQFISSSKIIENQEKIEGYLNTLRTEGVTIDNPDWDQWEPSSTADSGNSFAHDGDEGASANPFGEDTDEEEATPMAEDGNPFGSGKLSDISAIASTPHRSSRSLSGSSDCGVGNPF